MLPSLTLPTRRRVPLRPAMAALAAVLIVAALLPRASAPAPPPAPPPLATRLDEATWAIAVPLSWFAAPVPAARVDDRVDVIAVKVGDLGAVYPLALDATVLTLDERTLVIGVRADDAAQIAMGRANGLVMVPILRSRR